MKLDAIDRKILNQLQRNARISNVELAKRVNLSPSPCLERVKRLEQNEVIQGYHAVLTPAKVNAALLVFVEVTLDRTTNSVFEVFARQMKSIPEVLECHMVAGGFDYLLKLRFANMQRYRNFLGHQLASLPGISQTSTFMVMEEVKVSQVIDL
ncbi:MAG: Lrp/AsnC family leucine-responsive transcriptional regulator [Saprospiraceae bacterium]|jgi:Lrp/AsnC family leucine-responsive transcriptional regulator